MVKANELKKLETPYLVYLKGSLDSTGQRVSPPEATRHTDLTFVSTKEQLKAAQDQKAIIIIAHKKLAPELETAIDTATTYFTTSSIQAAMTVVLPFFDSKSQRWTGGVHPTAVIHPTAKIGNKVNIGAHTYVGEGVVVGNDCTLAANVCIESFAHLGSHCFIHPFVVIGSHCVIGAHCEIHSHSSIGTDGFGYYTENGQHTKVPQIGIVILEERVDIGACCTIDRATLTETRIKAGTKLDNHCHIAHNCMVGENAIAAAGFMMAGSSQIGKNFLAAGRVDVADHVTIADNVILGGRAGVANDIKTSGAFSGYPLLPIKDSLRMTASMAHLTEMRKDLAAIKKKLGEE